MADEIELGMRVCVCMGVYLQGRTRNVICPAITSNGKLPFSHPTRKRTVPEVMSKSSTS